MARGGAEGREGDGESGRGGGGGDHRTMGGRGRGGEGDRDQEGYEKWEKVVALVSAAFREGRLEKESTWQALVLIPKGIGECHGIGLVEVVWKVVVVIHNCRLTGSITYHVLLHGFQASIPVQVVIRLVQVHKYHAQDLLPHGR